MAIPSDLNDLQAWWKADSLSQGDASAVTSLPDSGPNGFTATQTTSSMQPSFRTNVINGLPVIRFDGSSDWLLSSAPSNPTEMSFFVVMKPTTATGVRTIRGGEAQICLSNSGRRPVTFRTSVGQVGIADTTMSATEFSISTFTYTDSGNAWSYYLDGAADGSGTTAISFSTARNTSIGRARSDAAQEFIQGDIAEIIIYSRVLNTTERGQVHSYLQDKYAIVVSDYIPSNLTVDVPIVDIEVEPTVTTAETIPVVTAFPNAQDITVQPINPTVQKIVDVPIVDIIVQPTNSTSEKQVNAPLPVDILVQPLGADASTGVPIVNIVVEPLPPTVGYSVEGTQSDKGRPDPPFVQPVRFIAQSILTKKFLHMDLPISNPEITKTLSGPQMITGEFSNQIRDLQDLGLTPHATWIHVEENGVIRASGILQPTTTSTSSEILNLEVHGVSAYPMDQPYMGELSLIQEDPADIVRMIWQHLQDYPNGDLGVVIRGTTTQRLGKPLPPPPPDPLPEDYVDPNPDDDDDKPYSLVWWEAPDCGQEINNLAQQTPFDYVERESWNQNKTDVLHFIDIGYPRIGRRLDQFGDPTFVEGENLIAGLRADETPNLYASEVYLYGKGEGRDIIRGYAGSSTPAKNNTDRVRKVVILEDSTIDTKSRADAICQDELMRRQAILDIQEIEIDARHDNAPIGSFSEGDEIFVRGGTPWVGEVRQWERILSYTFNTDTESAGLQLRRAESFRYGSGGPQ